MASELLSPAGDFETALAAFAAGADAVYCGLAEFSARAFAKNFSFEDLSNVLAYARKHRKRVFVTFNTLIDEDDFDGAIETLARLAEVRPDGVIVQDLGVAKLIRENFPELELHASTQLVAHNLEGVLALKELGFRRVVLARELSLAEITTIAQRCGARKIAADGRPELELEVFVHGALCYSLSGLCLFGAMEKGRSGNRGSCPYCCRQCADKTYPFSMKDLRLGEDARGLVEAGVSSLKIEGRMKSSLYVASVTRYYRDILDGTRAHVTPADLETVFSRRTTELYFKGSSDSPIDAESLGHRGTKIGTVKKVTKDRDGFSWLRFHTLRGLEKHDGLQFDAVDDDGKHLGLGIAEMRQAISRRPVFEVNAGVDVEILLPETFELSALRPGMAIYCSMSNAVKRMFPTPSFRPSDYEGGTPVSVEVEFRPTGLTARVDATEVSIPLALTSAKTPEKTLEGVRKAFSKLGGTGYRLADLALKDPERLFAPMSVLNDLRRDLVEKLEATREDARRVRIERAAAHVGNPGDHPTPDRLPRARVKMRLGQKLPEGAWDEIIVAINKDDDLAALQPPASTPDLRLALPVYTGEFAFNALRSRVKKLLREGYAKWECADLATLRLLKQLGVTDVSADWSLYAFNASALAQLTALGVTRFVASPENNRENLQYLAESGEDVEFLVQQSTPLFISLTEPAPYESESIVTFRKDGLWVTTKRVPRVFDVPEGASTRLDLSWDPA